jgi:hypothetical protein
MRLAWEGDIFPTAQVGPFKLQVCFGMRPEDARLGYYFRLCEKVYRELWHETRDAAMLAAERQLALECAAVVNAANSAD